MGTPGIGNQFRNGEIVAVPDIHIPGFNAHQQCKGIPVEYFLVKRNTPVPQTHHQWTPVPVNTKVKLPELLLLVIQEGKLNAGGDWPQQVLVLNEFNAPENRILDGYFPGVSVFFLIIV